jgi:hypothetical protein
MTEALKARRQRSAAAVSISSAAEPAGICAAGVDEQRAGRCNPSHLQCSRPRKGRRTARLDGLGKSRRGTGTYDLGRGEYPPRLTVFELPEHHMKRFRGTNGVERFTLEIKRPAPAVTLFPNEALLLRLVIAVAAARFEEREIGKICTETRRGGPLCELTEKKLLDPIQKTILGFLECIIVY